MKTAEPITLTGLMDLMDAGWTWVKDRKATLCDPEGSWWDVHARARGTYLFPVKDTTLARIPEGDR
jgi:hypothetical protein